MAVHGVVVLIINVLMTNKLDDGRRGMNLRVVRGLLRNRREGMVLFAGGTAEAVFAKAFSVMPLGVAQVTFEVWWMGATGWLYPIYIYIYIYRTHSDSGALGLTPRLYPSITMVHIGT